MSEAVRTVAGARWDCGGCTACCRHFALGPVSDAIIEGLEARGVREAWPPARGGFAVRRPGPDGRPAWFLARRDDGACVFLQDDGFCAVHARWGAQAKPAFCREYPYVVVADARGTSVVVRGDCGGWAESFERGSPVADQAAAVLALPRLHPIGRFEPDLIEVLPGVGLDGAHWPAIEAAVEAAIDDGAPPAANVSAIFAALAALVGRPAPVPQPDAARARLFAAQRLRASLRAAVDAPPPDDPEIRGMVAFLAHVLELIDTAVPSLPAARTPDPSACAYLALVLRSELLGRTFAPLGGLPVWLGTHRLVVELAAAASPGQGPVGARELGLRVATLIRLTRHAAARRVLADLRSAIVAGAVG